MYHTNMHYNKTNASEYNTNGRNEGFDPAAGRIARAAWAGRATVLGVAVVGSSLR